MGKMPYTSAMMFEATLAKVQNFDNQIAKYLSLLENVLIGIEKYNLSLAYDYLI